MSNAALFQTMTKGFDLAQAIAEADRCLLCHDPPCSKGCPAETDPGTFIRKLRLHNVTGAIRTIKTNNILGGACGVLCPTPRLCEKECSATGISRPLEIGKIQRALVEHGWKIGFQPFAAPAKNRGKVAVVGSGPAGLSCAAELAREGFAVTVFEERAEPGGVIRYGVPAYRFDSAFLAHEMADLQHLGVEFVCGTRIEGSQGAKKLLQQGFKAVFLGPGLWAAERIPGAEKVDGVLTSVDFLARMREQRFDEIGRQVEGKVVAVIGGGSVAMDCVESAAKLGARDAYLVYRRSFAHMPAEEDERLAALRLGVHFLMLNQPVGYAVDGKGFLTGVKLVRTRLGDSDASGRRKPEAIKGSEWTLEAQLAIEAIGNRPDAADWSGLVKTDRVGLVITDQTSGRTSAAFVYAGGDIARGAGLVVEAVQDGKRAARAIRAALA
ncbi:MAG: FAD-dependent oxidoreductase [Spirochaetia bacterium]|jgi:NADPH-dependent glutamate synthase beta subunit-like oxidoreductase